jgi:hypothetical protein
MSAASPGSNVATAELSEPARIVNILVAPGKTFSDLRHSSRWWAPWLLLSLASLAFVATVSYKVGFEQVSRSMIERSSRAEQFEKLPAQQKSRQLEITATVTKVSSYGTPVLQLLVFLIIAGLLLATFKVAAGADVPFKTALAIVCYSELPGVIYSGLAIITLWAGVNPEAFDIRNPVATNPAYFMDPQNSPALYALASGLDVFVIWSIVLMALGFSVNSRIKRSTTLAVIAGWYILYKLATAGITAIFS